jgi:hypothetical protein
MPLYLAGARMLTNYPTSIVVHGMAFNITVQSYAGALDFGMMADAKAMPDVKVFAQAVEIAFDDLRALPLPHELQAEGNATSAVVGRAMRSVRARVGDAVRGAVKGAVEGAVSGAMSGVMKSAVDQVRGAVNAAAGVAKPAPVKRRAAVPAKKSAAKRAKTGTPAAPRARRPRRSVGRCR